MGSAFALPWFKEHQNDKNNTVHGLTMEEAKISEAAKQGVLEILQDALQKKDKVLMQVPERVFLKGEEKEAFWMERHAILTEDIVKKLIAELKKVTFKKGICRPCTYAYIVRTDRQKIIYLCDMFWKASKYLGKHSQPGILIHELSHFLGTTDITYEESTLYVGCKGSLVKGSSENSSPRPPKDDYWEGALWKAFQNASSIADEFELTLSHKGSYAGGKYSCCGETKRFSVCESSVPDHFHTCTFDKTWKTEILLKELHQRSEAIARNLKESHKTIEDMHETFRKAMVSHFTKLAGGTAAAAASPLRRLTVSEINNVFTNISEAMETTNENKLHLILGECLRFADIQNLLKFLDGTEFFVDSRQEYEVHNLMVNTLGMLMVKELAFFHSFRESHLWGKCEEKISK